MNSVSSARPQAPEPSHQNAGAPTCQASPAMPMVAEPPMQDAAREKPVRHAPEERLLTKNADEPRE